MQCQHRTLHGRDSVGRLGSQPSFGLRRLPGSVLAKQNEGAMRKAQTALVLGCLLASSAWVKGSQQSGSGSAATQDSLNRAADAILALKSARFSLKREGTPAVLDEKNGVTFTAADCVYSAPDRVSCSIKGSLKNGTILQLTRVWVPEGTFQSNPLTLQFGKVPPDSNFNGVALFARSGIPAM